MATRQSHDKAFKQEAVLCWLLGTSVQKKSRTGKPPLHEEAEKYSGKQRER